MKGRPRPAWTLTSRASAEFHASLDPHTQATFNVSWAGEATSLNWMDTAREYTERWHHQQQIRVATNRPGILDRDTYYPVLDCFMRSLPHNYRDVAAPDGTTLVFRVTGEAAGAWTLLRDSGQWQLTADTPAKPSAEVALPDAIAWRNLADDSELTLYEPRHPSPLSP